MSATVPETRFPPLVRTGMAAPRAASAPGSLRTRPFLAIVCGFWLYATLSAVLYTYGLDATFAELTEKSLFASWRARVLQYLLLLLPLLGCYRLSLRLGWLPLRGRLWPQLGLGVAFALLARPALWVAMEMVGEGDEGDMPHKTVLDVLGWIGPEITSVWLASFTDFLVRYGFGLALVTGFAFYKRYRDAEMRVTALEQQWSAARLAALRMQLSPHTLFNLLHTIRGQIAWDPKAAQAMVVQLADLLRRLLNAGDRDFARLASELQFVRLYLELQCTRFPDRLTMQLPDAASLPHAWVPSLILQPLVENAVVHGLAGHDAPVCVAVAIEAAGERLRLEVSNVISAAAWSGIEGVGLRNVRERLAVQFGDDATFAAGPRDDGRWVSTIEMPLLREPPQDGAAR